MLSAVFVQAAAGALQLTVDKKSNDFGKPGTNWQVFSFRTFQACAVPLLLAAGIVAAPDGWEALLTPANLALLALSMTLMYASYPLRLGAYRNEKVTVLQPFAMARPVFTVILGFAFVASERANPWPFVFALLALAVIIGSQLKGGRLVFNRWSLMLAAAGLLGACQTFITVGFIRLLGGPAYYVAETAALLLISASALTVSRGWGGIAQVKRPWFALNAANGALGTLGVLILFEIYRTAGIVTGALAQLLFVAFVFVFSMSILRERPTFKDVAVSAAVAACVAAGVLMK